MQQTSSPRTRKLFRRPAIPLLELAVHAAKKAGSPTRASEETNTSNPTVADEGLEEIIDRHVAAKFTIIRDDIANEFKAVTESLKEHISDSTACAISCIRDCTEANEALARSEEREAALLAEREETGAKHDADIKAANDRVLYLERQLADVNGHTKVQKEQIGALQVYNAKIKEYNTVLEHDLSVEQSKVKKVEADQRESERRAATSEAKYKEAVAHTAELERRIEEIQTDGTKRELKLTQQLLQAGNKAAEQRTVLETSQKRVAALMHMIDMHKVDSLETELRKLKGRVESAQAELTDAAKALQASTQTEHAPTTHANSPSPSSKTVDNQGRRANPTPLAGSSRAANVAHTSSTPRSNSILRKSKTFKKIDSGKTPSRVRGTRLPTKVKQRGTVMGMEKENVIVEGVVWR